MSDNTLNKKELKRTIRLLREIQGLAERASTTGTLQSGGGQAAQQINTILQRMEQIGEIPAGYFAPVPADSSFDAIGVVAAQLAAYLHEEEQEGSSSDNTHHGPQIFINGPIGNLADIEQLRELGKIFRENMPDWFTGKNAEKEEKSEAPQNADAAQPTPPSPPTPPAPAAIASAAIPAQFTPDPVATRTTIL